MVAQDILNKLEAIGPGDIFANHDMSNYVSFKCGGRADYYSAPSSVEIIQKLIVATNQLDLPLFFLGGGSNIIFRDQGFHGLVISTANLHHFDLLDNNLLRVGAGLSIDALTAATHQFALQGFEWATGLPGSVGGGLFMNARCYGSSFSDFTKKVTYIDESGKLETISGNECKFNYKDSIFQHQPWLIVEAELQFQPGELNRIKTISQSNYQDRVNKHQYDYPSAGCVFKNDYSVGTPTGQLVENCGLKGRQIGGAKIFEHHANFIINTGSATTADIESLMSLISSSIQQKHGITLEPEIRLIS